PLARRPHRRASGRRGHRPDRRRLSGAGDMKQILRIALVACLLALTTPAWAHAPIMGIHGVFGGLLHALLIPEHGASLVALGLVLGRQQRPARRAGLLIFTAALAGGL